MNKVVDNTSVSQCDELTQLIHECNVFVSQKKWDKAEAAARQALSVDVESVTAHEILFLAVISSDQTGEFVEVIDSAVTHCATEPTFVQLGFALAGATGADAKRLYKKALAKWPDGVLVDRLQGIAGRHSASKKPVIKPELHTKRPNGIGADAFRLALHNDKKAALDFLQEYLESTNKAITNRAAQVSRIIQHLPVKSSFQRPLVIDEGAEITHSQKSLNGTTVVFFSGMGIDLEHSYELIDSYFSAAGVASVFLRDRSLNAFAGGLKSIANSRSESLTVLQKLLSDLGTSRLLCVGRSVGGFGALQYGLELEANRIVSFSGATDLSKRFWDSINDNRGRLVVERLNADNAEPDLRLDNVLRKSHLVSEGVHMYYGEGEKYDSAHAEHLSAVSGNINLHPVKDFTSHHTFHHFLENGQFFQKIAG